MDGIEYALEKEEPSSVLPEELPAKGAMVCLKVTGGIGDAIIAIGSVAPELQKRGWSVDAAVKDHQVDLIGSLEGVSACFRSPELNKGSERSKYSVIVDFKGTFNRRRELKGEDYYRLVEEKVGFEVSPGTLKVDSYPKELTHRRVGLHPGASNPNRRWGAERWEELAYSLRDRGWTVHWLGTSDEIGFSDKNIFKLSDISDDLMQQARHLSLMGYFIGNDSGFAHIAGILGIPGLVIFGNTHPDHVICRYPELKGVHRFDSDRQPTRSLAQEDLRSKCFMANILPENVLEEMPHCAIDCTLAALPKNPTYPKRRKLSFTLDSTNLSRESENNFLKMRDHLSKSYDVVPAPSEGDCDWLVIRASSQGMRTLYLGGSYRVDSSSFYSVERALREILHLISTPYRT